MDNKKILRIAYGMLCGEDGSEWDDNPEYVQAVIEFVGELIPVRKEWLDRVGHPFYLGMIYAAHLLATEGEGQKHGYVLYYTSADPGLCTWSVYRERYTSIDGIPVEGSTEWVSRHDSEAKADGVAKRLQDTAHLCPTDARCEHCPDECYFDARKG